MVRPDPDAVAWQDTPAHPPPLSLALLQRGQQRYRIYCTPCHSELGDGNGMVVQRGFPHPPSYDIDRLRDCAHPALLRCDDEWLRRHVFLRRPYCASRSLGDRRLHPGIAAFPACNACVAVRCAACRAAMMQERAERVAWGVGAIGLALALLGWLLEPTVFPHAWLAALSSWIGWPLGCLALLLVHALTGGRWGDAIRPQLLCRHRHAAVAASGVAAVDVRPARAVSVVASGRGAASRQRLLSEPSVRGRSRHHLSGRLVRCCRRRNARVAVRAHPTDGSPSSACCCWA